ncbi:MAG: outer membrane lipoprotein carrier protein LolA [Desulfovibrio sp.]|nr:MAG: outer membrane lipoprotein carrier protein LolA [Desulfovibrio sp.]
MQLKFQVIILGVLLAALALPGSALAQDVTEITSELQNQYETLDSFRADFTQVLNNAASGESQERSGELYYAKPDLIRWETTSPENELLIVGQNEVWDYFADEYVAYKYSLEAVLESKTMLRFISGEAKLDEEFYVEFDGEDEGLLKLTLLPLEPEPQLVEAVVWVDPDTYMFSKILVMDFYANENVLIFGNMERNPDLEPALFEFTPPEDVEIFDNTEE